MQRFKKKVELLVHELKRSTASTSSCRPATFYVFPNVAPICKRLGITSHGLAMYLLEGADDKPASRVWAANASARRARVSCDSVVPSR